MQQGGLSGGRQGFVEALHHQIGAALHCAFGKTLRKAEVRSVRFIDNQRNSPAVTDSGDGSDVADDSLVGRGGQNHSLGLWVQAQRLLDGAGRHAAAEGK